MLWNAVGSGSVMRWMVVGIDAVVLMEVRLPGGGSTFCAVVFGCAVVFKMQWIV